MPLQFIITEGLLTPAAEQKIFAGLTSLLMELNGLSDNQFLLPNVIGEITSIPENRTFSGGKPAAVAIFELKVPAIVLPTRDLQLAWIRRGTDLIYEAAAGKIAKDQIWGNVVHAVD